MGNETSSRQASIRAGVRRLRIDAEQAGQRVDNFLRRELPGLPKSRLYRVLRKGEVRVNGGRVRADYRLCEGDEVRIPPARISAGPGEAAPHRLAEIERSVLFEDKRVIVLNKPSGVAAHGGSGVSHGAIELLRALRPELRDLSLVHRLDRETSGCLVLAKRRSALRQLHEQFRDEAVQKNYLALVVGDWQLGDRLIDAPLLTEHRKKGERHVVVSGAGKPAQTRIRLSRSYRDWSLVQCQPLTGRTHQIRVHALHMGHPVAGDERYGDADANAAAARLGLRRLFLHAQSIAFADSSGNEMHFTAPLPDDLQKVLDRIPHGK